MRNGKIGIMITTIDSRRVQGVDTFYLKHMSMLLKTGVPGLSNLDFI